MSPISHLPRPYRWHGFDTADEMAQAAANSIVRAAHTAIHQHGLFRIVLAGGTTPHCVYERLRTADADWAAWHIYFGDERCLPADHAERNSRMAAMAWLDHVSIPPGQVHVIPAERGAPDAAAAYARVLSGIENFDLVLLGLGEDGHTASLFPGHDWGTAPDSPAVLAVTDAPKPPPQRVSLSARRLSASGQVIFLVTGEAKRQAIADWRRGAALPAAAIAPENGVDLYVENTLMPAAAEIRP